MCPKDRKYTQNPHIVQTHHQMASHHRHHHHHHHQGHCSSSSWCCCSSHIYQPSPPPQDPLLSLLLQPHPYSPHLTKPHTPPHHQKQHTHSILSYLLRRIHDLDSSLLHFSTPSSNAYSSYSLRDVAARIIQTHFRAFLVRRSTTLRHLKHLALVNSSLNSLKSSISNDDTHLHSEALSHQAMALLLKLDSIQGGDPLIRDGKRSIRRELVRFLEFIDGVSVKVTKNVRLASSRSRVLGSDCGDLGGDQREILKKLSGKLEKIRGFSKVSENDEESVELVGFQHISDADEENPIISINEKNGVLVKRPDGIQSRVKKSVSFAENGNVNRVFTYPNGSISSADGSVSSEDSEEGEIMENLGSEVEGMEEFSKKKDSDGEAHLENEGSQEASDGQRNHTRNLGSEISGHFQNQSGKFVFSAPLPVKMESRADLMKKRKAVKIVKF